MQKFTTRILSVSGGLQIWPTTGILSFRLQNWDGGRPTHILSTSEIELFKLECTSNSSRDRGRGGWVCGQHNLAAPQFVRDALICLAGKLCCYFQLLGILVNIHVIHELHNSLFIITFIISLITLILHYCLHCKFTTTLTYYNYSLLL